MTKKTNTLELEGPLAFVDVETTGLSPGRDRVIEIGIIRVKHGKIVDTLNTLVNPHMNVSPNIQMLTGIHPEDVYEADPFEVLYPKILRLLENAYFVAHNVRFDYAFVRNELKRLDISYSAKLLCTARLSRALYKRYRRHDLSSIIERHNIPCINRHRAYDDAYAMWDFFQIAQKEAPQKKWEEAVVTQLKSPTLPKQLARESIDALPDSPGVYKFYDKDSTLLYIGKSTNIRTRVRSHLTSDHLSAKQMNMCQQIADIDYIETAGELGALLLESNLIKKHKPIYNRQLRARRELTVLKKCTTNEGYDTVIIESIDKISVNSIDDIVGVFRSKKSLKDFLSLLSEKYTLCERFLGLHNTSSACFSHSLGICKGACVGKEKPSSYNRRFLLAFAENKIKPWYWEKPITLVEFDEIRGLQETFLIDKWCILNHSGSEAFTMETKQEYVFDIDTYNILVRFLSKQRNKRYSSGIQILTTSSKQFTSFEDQQFY